MEDTGSINKVCDMFMSDTKRDLNEVFDRVRKLETAQAVSKERDKTLVDKMDSLHEFFKDHDGQEMRKYDNMNKDIKYLTKFAYIATGVGLILGFVGIENIKLIIGG